MHETLVFIHNNNSNNNNNNNNNNYNNNNSNIFIEDCCISFKKKTAINAGPIHMPTKLIFM